MKEETGSGVGVPGEEAAAGIAQGNQDPRSEER